MVSPASSRYGQMKRWVGRGYAASKFDIVAVNKKLGTLSKRLGRQRRKK